MSNFRPVSNLSFRLKIEERAVAIRRNDYLVDNDLLPSNQLAYRRKHSTETVTLKVWSATLCWSWTPDKLRCLVFLTCRPRLTVQTTNCCYDDNFSLTDAVLNWIHSFLTDRTLQFTHDNKLSATETMHFSVPQRSMLGLLLYVLYTPELTRVVARHGMCLHQYTDDLSALLSSIQHHQFSNSDVSYVPVLSDLLKVAESARDLGVVIDSQLSSQLTSSCYADRGSTIAMIRPAAWSLSTEAAKTL